MLGDESMSFARDSKEELTRLKIEGSCCLKSELAAIIFINGSLNLGKETYLELNTENAAVARRIFTLFKEVFKTEPRIVVRQKTKLKKNKVYNLRIDGRENIMNILLLIGLMKSEGKENGYIFSESIDKDILEKECCKRSFLRGAYLATGSIAHPDNSYHLEILSEYKSKGKDLVEIMQYFGLAPGLMDKKNGYIVYIKGSDEISKFLSVIGAHKALLDFENVRVMKGMRNKINRLVNCETANLQKTVVASLRQIENIDVIDKNIGISNLPPELKEIAMKRVNYPEKNLKELGETLNPPLGKSGVNHRLRKLERIAKKLKN